jgi:peptide/nickel transport system substrate-binding protein
LIDYGLREALQRVCTGSLSRRELVRGLLALGLTGPLIAELLRSADVAQAQPKRAPFTPARRGGGGELKLLWWQAPTILNPHLAIGVKDGDGSRLFYEPLVSFDPDGNLVPVLVTEVPTVQNGGVARDGLSVTVKLKKGVQWHDGKPFTADDVVFTWEYAADPATLAVSIGSYRDIVRVDKLDSHTVKIVYKTPTPFWANAFRGVIPRHVFEPFKGGRSREAPANLRPVGTGPYRVVDFKPGDIVRGEIFAGYHEANWPFFDRVEMKGGGDAVSAARAVLQTGEYDYAREVGGVEDDVLVRLESSGGKGRVVPAYGGRIMHLALNQSDPWTEVDGERSSAKTTHPFLTDPAVRGALALLVDRAAVQEQIYGRTARATGLFLNNPDRFRSKNSAWEFNVDKANRLLDAGGWIRGADGVRAKGGKRLKMLFQTITNGPAQKVQAIVKQAATRAGFEVELKSVPASVFYGADPGNTETYTHFYADIQLQIYVMGPPDPGLLMRVFGSDQIASKANKWQRFNVWRYRNDEYDRIYRASETEMDPVKRAALFIRMNDIVVQDGIVVPIAMRARASALSRTLRNAETNPYSEIDFWNIGAWYREA